MQMGKVTDYLNSQYPLNKERISEKFLAVFGIRPDEINSVSVREHEDAIILANFYDNDFAKSFRPVARVIVDGLELIAAEGASSTEGDLIICFFYCRKLVDSLLQLEKIVLKRQCLS